MTDREKLNWSGWLIGLWSFTVAVVMASAFGAWVSDDDMVRGFSQLGQMLLTSTGAWTLGLTYRLIYLKGKRSS